jgi:hypothetical protein
LPATIVIAGYDSVFSPAIFVTPIAMPCGGVQAACNRAITPTASNHES